MRLELQLSCMKQGLNTTKPVNDLTPLTTSIVLRSATTHEGKKKIVVILHFDYTHYARLTSARFTELTLKGQLTSIEPGILLLRFCEHGQLGGPLQTVIEPTM